MTAEALESGRKATLQRRIRIVVALTITWNVIEAVVALAAGGEASSAALIGFGLDSVVEVLSAVAVAWQFASPDPERREKTALRVIAISFFALALYVTTEAVLSLTGVREPEHSTVGIVLAALSLVVMPFLSWFERRCGRELGSASAVADSKQTLMCSYLSAALLVGARAEQPARLDLGRSRGGPGHRRIRCSRGRRGMAWRRLLRHIRSRFEWGRRWPLRG